MNRSHVHEQIRARFRAAFGEPHNTLGSEAHWALRPLPHLAAINILLDGSSQGIALWVFNPHDPVDEVLKTEVTTVEQADRLIAEIRRSLAEVATRSKRAQE